MLTTPDPSLVLHVPGNGFLPQLFKHLLRDPGGADQLVVPSFLLLALLEDRRGVCFPPVIESQNRRVVWLGRQLKDDLV